MNTNAILFLVVMIVVNLGITKASGQNNFGRSGVGIVHGKCLSLTVGGNKILDCRHELANVTLADGTVQFIVSTKSQMISFSGDGRRAAGSGRSMKLPIKFINISENGSRPTVVPATGNCRSGDPFSGKPIKIDCSVKTSFGNISFSFQTNGRPPAVR